MVLPFILSPLPWQFIPGCSQHSLLFTLGTSDYRIEFCHSYLVSGQITLFPGLPRPGEEYLAPVQRPGFLPIFMLGTRRFRVSAHRTHFILFIVPVQREWIFFAFPWAHAARMIRTGDPTPALVHFFSTNVPYSLALSFAPPFSVGFQNSPFLQLPSLSHDQLQGGMAA
jgi:hypothetical protein